MGFMKKAMTDKEALEYFKSIQEMHHDNDCGVHEAYYNAIAALKFKIYEDGKSSEDMLHDECTIQKAIKVYGSGHQTDKAIEELGELIDAILKQRQGRCDISHIAEEIADVYIMLKQLEVIYSIPAWEIDDWIMVKLSRLDERLKDK